jgi:hypothetical protein
MVRLVEVVLKPGKRACPPLATPAAGPAAWDARPTPATPGWGCRGNYTTAGDASILDVVTGKEPRTFLGDFYEEIAIIGALLLIGGLFISEHINYNRWIIPAIVTFTWCFVFLFRLAVVRYNLQSWKPGD